MTQKLYITLALIGIIVLGFFREFLFIHINEQLFALWYDEPSRASDAIPFLKEMDYYPLYYSKWGLTVLFAWLFYAATVGILKLIFNSNYWKVVGVFYLLLGVLSIASYAIGVLLNNASEGYIIARFLAGIAQSPLPLMVMIPGVWLKQGVHIEN